MTAVATRRTGLALLLAALILGVCPTTWPAASGPVVTDATAVEPTLTPPVGAGARMVARQIRDARRGTP